MSLHPKSESREEAHSHTVWLQAVLICWHRTRTLAIASVAAC
ncbi:hypothetical protein PLANPX_1435 [Lacipirellula parvula]|uniref:Uncharacterized protein n=1 Tax=Lacipirellula parvula TaxID=2650471 RepID=A0A5K7XC03_9BACT|nr:hypothetical protein PLANPX_1435 [Lacipirellula parvula]